VRSNRAGALLREVRNVKLEALIGVGIGLLLAVAQSGCTPQQAAGPSPPPARQRLSPQAQAAQVRCNAGDQRACGELGNLYLRGIGTPRNLDTAASLLQPACNAGLADACADLGEVYIERQQNGPELTQAAQLFQAACARGSSKGCARFGRSLVHGVGLAPNVPAGIELLEATCQSKEPEACLNLGAFLISPSNPRPDPLAAIELFEKAVARGSGHGTLGLMYWKGYGVSRDTQRARALFEQGCRQAEAEACLNLAIMCQLGEGGPSDHDAAVRYVRRACDLGLERACAQEEPK
jgi:TPR repeat protein